MLTLNRLSPAPRLDDVRRAAERAATHRTLPRVGRTRPIPPELAVTIRYGSADDALALARLAALDSRPVPVGPVLVAEVEDELQAALSLSDGATIADPFRPTAGLLQLLVNRAAQLRREGASRSRRTSRPTWWPPHLAIRRR